MKVGVLGGAGFLGSHVADELTRRGYDVIVFDCKPSPYLLEGQVEFIGSILDKQQVSEFVSMCEVIYNFAGLSDLNASVNEPELTLSLNVMGNLNVLEACKQHGGIKRFIYASSAYVFSSKGSFYGISKRCSEQLIEEYHRECSTNYTVIRYGSVYGPRADEQNRVYRIIKQALKERKIESTLTLKKGGVSDLSFSQQKIKDELSDFLRALSLSSPNSVDLNNNCSLSIQFLFIVFVKQLRIFHL